MLRDEKCGLCDEFLGRMHGCNVLSAFTRHFREKHQEELEAITQAKEAYKELRKKYCYRGFVGL